MTQEGAVPFLSYTEIVSLDFPNSFSAQEQSNIWHYLGAGNPTEIICSMAGNKAEEVASILQRRAGNN
jgi:hypothetical protein